MKQTSAESPEVIEDEHAYDELVDGRGMDAAIGRRAPLDTRPAGAAGRNQAVGKGHAPGQRGGLAVVAVAGDEAAEAADGVADGGGGGASVHKREQRDAIVSREINQRDDAGDEAAEPCESGPAEEH